MGISSDGVLYFGFQVGGDGERPEWMGEFEDFDDWLCNKAGLTEDAPWEERQPIIHGCPAELQMFCSYNYPMFVLGVRGAEHRAYRGDIVEIGTAQLAVEDEKTAAFKAWCETNGIEYQEPKWLLCSMYG
jgi:hypothetical protein